MTFVECNSVEQRLMSCHGTDAVVKALTVAMSKKMNQIATWVIFDKKTRTSVWSRIPQKIISLSFSDSEKNSILTQKS